MTTEDSSFVKRSSYVGDRLIADADGHFMETAGWLEGYADSTVRQQLDPLPWRLAKTAMESTELLPDAVNGDFDVMGRKDWSALGATISEGRRMAMDYLGVQQQLIFSTFAARQFLYNDDLNVVYGGAEAMNRGIVDFCSIDNRMLPVGMVPFHDPERALSTLRRALSDGAQAIQIPSVLFGDVAPTHPAFELFWETLAESGRPFVLHPSEEDPAYDDRFSKNGLSVKQRFDDFDQVYSKEFMAVNHSAMMFLSVLIFDGLFDRFPSLRGACMERGTTWIPGWLRQMDLSQKLFGGAELTLDQLSKAPSEYVRDRIWFTPTMGEPIDWVIEQCEANLLMFSTDYPHVEGGCKPLERADRMLADMTSDVKETYFYGNFQKFMNHSQPSAPHRFATSSETTSNR